MMNGTPSDYAFNANLPSTGSKGPQQTIPSVEESSDNGSMKSTASQRVIIRQLAAELDAARNMLNLERLGKRPRAEVSLKSENDRVIHIDDQDYAGCRSKIAFLVSPCPTPAKVMNAAKDKVVEPEEGNKPDVTPKNDQDVKDIQPSTKPVRHDIGTPPSRGRRKERDHSRTPPGERLKDVEREGGYITPRKDRRRLKTRAGNGPGPESIRCDMCESQIHAETIIRTCDTCDTQGCEKCMFNLRRSVYVHRSCAQRSLPTLIDTPLKDVISPAKEKSTPSHETHITYRVGNPATSVPRPAPANIVNITAEVLREHEEHLKEQCKSESETAARNACLDLIKHHSVVIDGVTHCPQWKACGCHGCRRWN